MIQISRVAIEKALTNMVNSGKRTGREMMSLAISDGAK